MTHRDQDRLLRVVHVTPQLDMGGMEKLLVEFARHADRCRFQLQFISLGTRGCLAEEIDACGWPVAELGKRPGLRMSLVVRLARLFRQWRPDVVHTHNNPSLIYAAPAARLAGVRAAVHTRHGQGPHASRREMAACRFAARLVNRVVCVSDDSAGISAREGIPGRRLCRIWNGIDVARFRYTGPRPDGPVVMVGRMVPLKDVGTLLQAAALAVREDPSFELHVAGDGECLSALKEQSSALGLQRHVRFLGLVRDVPALLAQASLFVLPSLSEGISLTLLEAMAVGLPIITTPVGGNPEVVVDGHTGLLIPVQRPAELAQAMLRLRRNPAEGRRMGAAGRRRVEEHFEIRGMVREYERLYGAVLGRRHATAGALVARATGELRG
jgi:sugar transferase (PEP-CTERM/EpsH1 system associated)